MRRPLRVFVAFSLCFLALNPQPRPQRDTPPIITPSATPVKSWDALRTRIDDQARFYTWASQLPAPQPAKKPATIATSRRIQAEYEPGSIESIICSVFADNCGVAIAKARCESGLNPSAYNRSGASGLFQIMMPMHADLFNRPEDVFDPLENSRAAFTLSHGGTNWSAWVC